MLRPRHLGGRAARLAMWGCLPVSAVYLHCAAQVPEPPQRGQLQRSLSATLSDCMPASLVTALRDANAAGPGPHTISLKAGCTYSLAMPDNYWYGPNALPPIASDITVEGNGAVVERAEMAPKMRLLFVAGAPTPTAAVGGMRGLEPGKLTLRNLTLRGGLARGGAGGSCAVSGGGGAGLGGALFAQGQVTLWGVTLWGNRAEGGAGGTGTSAVTLTIP